MLAMYLSDNKSGQEISRSRQEYLALGARTRSERMTITSELQNQRSTDIQLAHVAYHPPMIRARPSPSRIPSVASTPYLAHLDPRVSAVRRL